MALQKVKDTMRTTVALDATKLAGTVAEARLATLDATKLTGTVDNARISLDAAEIPSLDAAKITSGDIALARLGNVPPSDTTSIQNDISLLALQTAINGNLSAYGLKNSWIEQFEDSTKIEALTQCGRNVSTEYMSTSTAVAGTPAYATGNRKSIINFSYGGFTFAGGTPADMLNGTSSHYGSSAWATTMTPSANAYMRFGFTDNNSTGSTKKLITEIKFYQNYSSSWPTQADWKWQGSNSTSGPWTDIGSTFTMAGNITAAYVPEIYNLSSNTIPYTYYQMRYVSGNNNGNPYWVEIEFKQADVTGTADTTGSFNSTDITPSDGAAKTEVGLVILYKDALSTVTTLNTHLIARVRANTGQAYSANTLVLAGIDGTTTPSATYSDGMKIAIAPAVTVTSGTALSYEIAFAGQSGSLDTRVHGVAMTY